MRGIDKVVDEPQVLEDEYGVQVRSYFGSSQCGSGPVDRREAIHSICGDSSATNQARRHRDPWWVTARPAEPQELRRPACGPR